MASTSKAPNNEESVFVKLAKHLGVVVLGRGIIKGSLAWLIYVGNTFFPISRTKTKQNKCCGSTTSSLGNTTINSRLMEFKWKLTPLLLEDLPRTPLFMCMSTPTSSLLKPWPERSQGFKGTMVLIWLMANATVGRTISQEEMNLDHIQMFW